MLYKDRHLASPATRMDPWNNSLLEQIVRFDVPELNKTFPGAAVVTLVDRLAATVAPDIGEDCGPPTAGHSWTSWRSRTKRAATRRMRRR